MQQLLALAKRKTLLTALILFAAGALVLLGWRASRAPAAPAPAAPPPALATPLDDLVDAPPTTPDAAQEQQVIAYITGAVRAPDVYRLPAEARVKDLVLAAGGPAPDADLERINLAERLKDGDHIHIPRQGELTPTSAAPGDAAGAASAPGAPVDINTASAAEMDGLPGIGQALAQRIVEYRSANGPFKSVDDLRNVKGIGAALLDKIAPLVMVGP